MISFNEMIKGKSISDIPIAHQQNIQELLTIVNPLFEDCPYLIRVTSAYRTTQDHLRIYRAKGIPDDKIPFGSLHLKGCAVDIYDPKLLITKWLKENNSKRLVAAKAYCEEGNADWVHVQSRAPKSGKRWFLP